VALQCQHILVPSEVAFGGRDGEEAESTVGNGDESREGCEGGTDEPVEGDVESGETAKPSPSALANVR
jgi:hypothetical protein